MPADSSVVALQNEAHPRMTWPSYKVDKKNIDIAITTHQFSDKRLCINHNFPVLKHWSQSSVQSNFKCLQSTVQYTETVEIKMACHNRKSVSVNQHSHQLSYINMFTKQSWKRSCDNWDKTKMNPLQTKIWNAMEGVDKFGVQWIVSSPPDRDIQTSLRDGAAEDADSRR